MKITHQSKCMGFLYSLQLPALLMLLWCGCLAAESRPLLNFAATAQPVWAKQGMVVSQQRLASKAGLDILRKGGNAVDAAVAVGFTLAVTLPRAGNLGGGGFMMIHLAEAKKTLALDYREMAPAAASRDMYLNADGSVDKERSRFHGLAVGVPGTVLGLVEAQHRYGILPLQRVMRHAIQLAEQGFRVDRDLAKSLQQAQKRLSRFKDAARVFFHRDGRPYRVGETLRQPALARTLRAIATQGAAAFYRGDIAKKIAAAVNRAGGSMLERDLNDYKVHWRKPVTGSYRGYRIASMPPPSSGGTHIIEILNIMENFDVKDSGHNSAQTVHLMTEAMRRAYADRSEYLGDPDFVNVPIAELTSKAYAKRLALQIDPDKANSSQRVKPGLGQSYESPQTTHFSVVDRFGNAVSNTYTLNFSYGSGIIATGTGVLLNNEMDDFSAKPGVANAYGLIGADANAIEPRKRPLSSMSPTFVFKPGSDDVFLVTGSPGGSRIITTTLQVISNVIDHAMNIAEATQASRFHHQWLPDHITVEKGFSVDTLNLLRSKGHAIEASHWAMGSTQSILRVEDGWTGASDPRQSSGLAAGY